MIDDIKKEARERMSRSLEALSHNFNKIRTGRAHPSLLDDIRVEYYGADTPLNQMANITVEDGRTLAVTAWVHFFPRSGEIETLATPTVPFFLHAKEEEEERKVE